MSHKINILIAEHEPSDIELLCEELKSGGIDFISEIVNTEKAFTSSIKKFKPDLILSDYSFPNFSGVAAFHIREELAPHTPFIMVSGTIGEENSVEMIKIGVSDYVLKDKLFSLVPKVNRAMKELMAWKKKEEVQNQLVLSEALLAEAQAIAKTGSWVTELSDLSVTWSRETFRIYGMEAHTGSISHAEFLELVHPEDRLHVNTAFKNSLNTFSVNTIEHRIITLAGELKFVEENWKIIRDEHGIPLRSMGSCQEITERKQLEEQREFERANLANAQNLAQMGSWDYNILTDKINWSDALYFVFDVNKKTFGTDHDSFFQLIDEKDRKRVQEVVRNTEETGDPFTIEYGITTPFGEKKIIQEHGYGKKDENGKVIHLFGTAQNISEAKRYEAAILKAYEEKNAVLESIDDGFFTLDKNSHVTYWNKKAESLLNTKKEDIIGKNIHEVFESSGSIGFREHYEKAARENITLHFEEFSKLSNKWFAVSAFGSEKGLSVYFKNVTENKNAAIKIIKANRLYNFISQINQSIVHIQDAPTLFRNSCQVAFEFGKFKIAWIGLIDNTGERISLVDQKGLTERQLHLFSDVKFEKSEPLNSVLRTGKYYICNDVENDLKLKNWRTFALDNGICSFIILPIKKSNRIIGTFNLFAAELNFFDNEEIQLLTDVVEDISFALDLYEQITKHRETEELLIKNEKRFRALIDKSADMKTLTSINGELLYGSNSITKYLGYTMEEYQGKFASDFIHPGDGLRPGTMQEIMQNPGKAVYVQQRMRHKNGNWIWCEGTITNLLQEPAVNALVSNFRDITEKKELEAQQEFDGNNLNALINNTHGLMWSVDRKFNLITSNEKFEQSIYTAVGFKIDKGCNILSPEFPEELLTRYRSNYERAFTGETFTETEYFKMPDELWLETSYYPIRKGNEVIGTACHSSNITERKNAEKKDKFQAILLNTIGQATIATDMQGNINFWNEAASTIYGWTEEEVLGKNITNITCAEQTKDQAEQIMQELLLGNTWTGEFVVKRKDGSEFLAFVTNAPIYDQQQQLIGIIGVSSDITSWKQAEQRLKESNERYKVSEIQLNELHADLLRHIKELALSNAELEQFAYVASHDLQEPLRMITSFLSQLDKKYSSLIDEKGKKYIHFAVDGAKRMRLIILDLLEFSRVGRIEDKLEKIDINLVVEEIQNLYRKQISEKETVICIDNLPVITSYHAPIRQVFQNLVGNALKYTRKDQPCHIKITAVESADFWEFAIADNGIGIPKEYFDKIFIIFQRLHNKDEYSGTGMGLAVTKKIIENLGGKIQVDSEEDKGSAFYFTIPKKMI